MSAFQTEKRVPRFIELVRVSTASQADKDTPQNQRSALQRLRTTRPGEFVERIEPPSGSISRALPLTERPDLLRLLDLSRAKAYDEIRVVALDRLSRSADPRERVAVLGMIAEAGAVIVEANGNVIDPREPMGELGSYLSLFFAAEERRKILARSTAGRRRAIASGKYLGGDVIPYGYRWTGDAWAVDPARAAVVLRIYRAAADNKSGQAIADELNAAGVPTDRGARWRRSTVQRMLRTPVYSGSYPWRVGGEQHTVALPRIVPPDLHAAAQAAVDGRRNGVRRRNGAVAALLRGIAVCGECGRSMWVDCRKARIYYICSSARERGAVPCAGARYHPVPLVDDAVWRAIVPGLRDPSLLREAAAPKAPAESWTKQIAACEARLARIERDEVKTLRMHSAGMLSDGALNTRLRDLIGQRDATKRALEGARKGEASAAVSRRSTTALGDRVRALAARLDDADNAARAVILGALIPRAPGYGVTLHRDRRIDIQGALDVCAPPQPARRASSRTASGSR